MTIIVNNIIRKLVLLNLIGNESMKGL